MRRLQSLRYAGFPAACMPSVFPQSLQEVALYPLDWRHDLPLGLKDLQELESFSFNTRCKTWDIVKPLAELLPVDGLRYLALASRMYSEEEIRQGDFLAQAYHWESE